MCMNIFLLNEEIKIIPDYPSFRLSEGVVTAVLYLETKPALFFQCIIMYIVQIIGLLCLI